MKRSGLLIAMLAAAPPLAAQNSAYGVLGIGFPGRLTSVRARALGDALAALDPQSSVNPAALGAVGRLGISIGSIQEYRSYSIGGQQTADRHQARFPYGLVGSRLARSPLSFGIGYEQYADRTFDLTTSQTLVVRGDTLTVDDRVASVGGVADIRAALAWVYRPRLHVGAAIHLIGGSAKLATNRTFSDPVYRPFSRVVDATFSGLGVSVGVVAVPVAGMRVGLAVRTDTRLEQRVGGQTVDRVALPTSLTGGLELAPGSAFRVSLAGAWRSWSNANGDLEGSTRAADTWQAGLGIEIGGPTAGPTFPVRLGVRYAALPFSPTADQPHELAFSGGTAIRFAGGRVRFDGTVERTRREGAGLSERAWQFLLGMQIIP